MSKQPAQSIWRSSVVWVCACTGILLVAFVGASAWRISVAAKQLDRGQGELLFTTVTTSLHKLKRRPTVADLDAIVDAQQALGLVSVVFEEGTQRLSSTSPAHTETRRVRRPIPPPPGAPARPPPGAHRPPPRDGFRPPRRPLESDAVGARPPAGARPSGPPMVTVTFTGEAAASAERLALLQVLFAVLAASAIWALGFLFARADRRREGLQHELGEQRLLASLGEMSAVLAHEIRNPLGALKGHAQLLVEECTDDGRDTGRADRLVHEATRLEAIVSDLLTFIRSGDLELVAQPIAPIVRDAVARVPDAAVELEMRIAPEVSAPVDAGRFGLVLENILQNAATAGSGVVSIVVDKRDDQVEISIEDDGPGVDVEVKDRIFEPFVTTKTKGVGLGLALSARIMEAHGGTLAVVAPTILGGAAFRIRLPAYRVSGET